VPRRGWAGAGDVLLVVLVTALQVAGPRSGSPGQVPDLLAGPAGAAVGVAAALVGGVALWWRRSRPAGVLAVCVAGYAVNAAMVPGVPPYAGWVALYAAGVYGGRARRAAYAVAAGAVALGLVFGVCALAYPKTAGELVVLTAVTMTAGVLGMLVRARRAQLGALRDRAATLEREQESAAARGAAEERLRIARDVHVPDRPRAVCIVAQPAAADRDDAEIFQVAAGVRYSPRAAVGQLADHRVRLIPVITQEVARARLAWTSSPPGARAHAAAWPAGQAAARRTPLLPRWAAAPAPTAGRARAPGTAGRP
jgi:hypothetical protein